MDYTAYLPQKEKILYPSTLKKDILTDIRQLKVLVETLEEEFITGQGCISELSEIHQFTALDQTLADRIRQYEENRMFLGVI